MDRNIKHTHTLDKQPKYRTIISYLTDTDSTITDDPLKKTLNPFRSITMTSRANSSAPADTLTQIFAQLNQLSVAMNTLTTSVSNLTRENENRTFEISEIAKKIGLLGTIETDNY